MKNVSVSLQFNKAKSVFLTSAVQKKWQIVTFSGSGLQYPFDTCRSINGNVRVFDCLTWIWSLKTLQFIVDPLSVVFIVPFLEIKLLNSIQFNSIFSQTPLSIIIFYGTDLFSRIGGIPITNPDQVRNPSGQKDKKKKRQKDKKTKR